MLLPARLLLVPALLFALLVATVDVATAAPATVTVASDKFTPGDVTVETGETVTWNFNEASHNVKGEGFSGNNTFGKGTYTETFTKTGTFAYVCEAHSSMKGSVTVTAAAAAAPAAGPDPAAAAPAPSGAGEATPWAFPKVDRLAPVLKVLRATKARRARKAQLTVRLDQDAIVVVGHGRRVVRLRGRRGLNRFVLPARSVTTRRVRVVAVDVDGNESAVTTAALR